MMQNIYILILVSALALSGCATLDLSLQENEKDVLSQSNIDSTLIDEALDLMGNSKINSMIISCDDEILIERYNNGFDGDDKQDLRSATKSVTSLLVGIAIDRGFIDSVNKSIMDYFPEYSSRKEVFAPITIGHLLTMTSGLNSDDWDSSSPGNEEKMYRKKSWVDFYFSLDRESEAGEVFKYSTAGVVLLGEIIRRSTGLDYRDFADKYLFTPLGIEDYLFETTRAGESDAGGHLRLTPSDFHKIAQIYLHKGFYKNKPIVSEQWIEESLTPRIQIIRERGEEFLYEGYLLWLEPVVDGKVRSYQARGNGGQYLIVIPELDLICSFTGSAYNSSEQMLPFYLVKKFIIPAIKKDD
ncbi:serine hydrolase domain-containing protein [Spirochaeta isovalerica]|uniref:CubicO group peptidase (Beta-lactamase class C family) n=1 Tax=Spirochaeta isovalerica TaxID=150 RepID=A0A841RDF3_9SPIO|nr:serine hydrolase [Spirochaeta isovalerica]MBB6482065.1 CubicO group peptidase (beta-lactamase class C family) [Spirochaeta isovalerica]